MRKAELRKIYIQKRKELSEEQVRLKSLDLLRQLKETSIFENQIFHVFISIEKLHEVFTWVLIEFLRMKKKTIVVSSCEFKTTTLNHFVLDKTTILKENSYGVPEPIGARQIDPKKLDVVFVPLLISDKENYRVGYGKGYYDRFLAECREDIQTIGLNFFEPIEKIEDINEYDIPLKKVLYG
ncbi:MAG: 5-formyltetrahydrofolate cyclo-ligase [Flavobacteriales bacterium]